MLSFLFFAAAWVACLAKCEKQIHRAVTEDFTNIYYLAYLLFESFLLGIASRYSMLLNFILGLNSLIDFL